MLIMANENVHILNFAQLLSLYKYENLTLIKFYHNNCDCCKLTYKYHNLSQS